MDVTLSATEIAPGESVTITVTVRNDRTVPVPIGLGSWDCGGLATTSGGLVFPLDPVGREWDGIAAVFKHYTLTEGRREGGAPIGQPFPVHAARSGRCLDPSSDFILDPGAAMTESMVWSALLGPGVLAMPGTVPINVSVLHDTFASPTYPPGWQGPSAMWFRSYEQLTVTASLEIVGPAPPILSVGQAIDVLLADGRFSGWLGKEPSSTWSGANVLLHHADKAQGITPAGLAWEIDLFREIGVPRNWAIGFVDFGGELVSLTLCDAPCDR
jgi:hypothetical protein